MFSFKELVPVHEVERALKAVRQIEKRKVVKGKSSLVGYVVNAEHNLLDPYDYRLVDVTVYDFGKPSI